MIELMVTVGLMALIATAIGIAVLRAAARARVASAATEVRTVRTEAVAYRTEGHAECPTMDVLLTAGVLDEDTRTVDPWNSPYRIECDGERTIVRSSGPDERFDTEDDVTSARSRR